jgi:hypothetical protein
MAWKASLSRPIGRFAARSSKVAGMVGNVNSWNFTGSLLRTTLVP